MYLPMNPLAEYFNGFISLIYPNICILCRRQLIANEQHICSICLFNIPKTEFENTPGNNVEKLFWGRAKIDRASSYFFYQKENNSQKVIHQIKYKCNKELGHYLGKKYGTTLKDIDWIKQADYLLPVPLHRKKLKSRGYNQAEIIANGISETTEIPVNSNQLYRTAHSDSQTRKGRYHRWKNVSGIFGVRDPKLLTNKTVIIVDDVVTTGATIEACTLHLEKIPGITIHTLSLGVAVN